MGMITQNMSITMRWSTNMIVSTMSMLTTRTWNFMSMNMT